MGKGRVDQHCNPLDMLSRWKGMETPYRSSSASDLPLWICFPVGREWKLRLQRIEMALLITLDMLSRWKGMETEF